jgi:hypothetical protein
MAKRKAKDLEGGIPAEEPRRSSRRVASAKDEVVPEKTSKPTPAPKPPKKVQKPTKDVSIAVSGDEGKKLDTVSALNLF